MYTIEFFAAVITAADRMKNKYNLEGFLSMFEKDDEHLIKCVLYDADYIDARWEADMFGGNSKHVEFWKEN